ncbi:MAG: hypothetical protein HY901_09975 [Deltaproteobacteria bacterium]|nr:hypothetical protein [Deltaproteobacteria bacterium]
MNLWLAGKRIALKPASSLGKGGEADVYDLGDGRALKVFKAPDHPDYQGLPHEQVAAERRIAEHQVKLRVFPKSLPAQVVAPEDLATDQSGRTILGYAMRKVTGAEALFRLADPAFRRAGYPAHDVVALFAEIHGTVGALHAAGLVIGDFNDRNVLVVGARGFLIDSDSFQFGQFLCPVFTDRFVDPLLCDGAGQSTGLRQVKPHGTNSDWYAFAALLMQSLLFVGPYGGVFKPKDPAARVPQSARPLSRITVFHQEVVYPKPAVSPSTLPDSLLEHFHRVFQKDERKPFPVAELQSLRFARCPQCQTEHARLACPTCRPTAALAMKKQVAVRVRGEVTCERLFHTRGGVIVAAAIDRGELRLVFHEDGAYRREDGMPVLRGPLDPSLCFALRGRDTLVGRGGEVVTLSPGKAPEKLLVDQHGHRPAFGTCGEKRIWAHDGRLMRDGSVGPELIGEVLAGQTRLFLGSSLGVGLYRAGTVSVALLFDAAKGGLNDQLKLPKLTGELLDVDAVSSEERAWMRLVLQEAGRTRHLCLAWSRHGVLEGTAETSAGDGTWLGTLGGACAVGGMLLVATDVGIVRVEEQGGALVQTREFPDTEPFVASDCRLLVGRKGLIVVRPQEIVALQMP